MGENGSGKTTLIKLLTRLYYPDKGRILLDGMDLKEWDEDTLRQRIGVIFQDFSRYQFLVGENIGAGDVRQFEDESRWKDAADKGMADDFIEDLPSGYKTQLGKWFKDGQELSGGQWQKIALSRAFMRTEADILVLDEPTAAMDAAAEARIFEHFRKLTQKPHRHPDLAPFLHRAHGQPDHRHRKRPGDRAWQSRGVDGTERALCELVFIAGGGLQISRVRQTYRIDVCLEINKRASVFVFP